MKSYYTLIASLPAMPRQFDDGPIPITASSLGHRISMLDNDDQQIVRQLSDFFLWDRQPRDRSDSDVKAMHQRLTAQIHNPLVAHLVNHRLMMRTLIAAVRCQRNGDPPPDLPELPLSVWIQRHWDQPRFRLDARFDWLPRFCDALDAEQPEQAQWHLFAELWNHWSRLNEQYYFTFESFVLYLARWEVLHRWASQDAAAGKQRFDALVDDILQSSGASL